MTPRLNVHNTNTLTMTLFLRYALRRLILNYKSMDTVNMWTKANTMGMNGKKKTTEMIVFL